MATHLECPDCGGLIGDVPAGATPCTCYFKPAHDAKSDTAELESPKLIEKFCVVCGKDTIGHRRLKDSRGYICYPCAKAEQAAEKAGKVRCQFCRKLIKPDGLVPMGKRMVRKRCFADHEETARFKKKVSTKHYDTHEKRNLIVLAVIAVVLLGFMLAAYFR